MTHDPQERAALARHREQLAASVLATEIALRDHRERVERERDVPDPDDVVEHPERWEA